MALAFLLLIHLSISAHRRQELARVNFSADLQPQRGTWHLVEAVGAAPSLNDSSRAAALTAMTDTAMTDTAGGPSPLLESAGFPTQFIAAPVSRAVPLPQAPELPLDLLGAHPQSSATAP